MRGVRIAEGGPDFATMVAQASPGRKLLLAVQSAASDFLDVAFYFVIGASLASIAHPDEESEHEHEPAE